MPSRRPLIAAVPVLLAAAGVLTACAPASAPQASVASASTSPAAEPVEVASAGGDGWVVVMFEDRPAEFDTGLMDALLEMELAADEALGLANAGAIDGNDVGANGYELYFIGDDPMVMWRVLEPVFAAAPVAWTRVELRNGLDDTSPTVLVHD